MLLDYIQDYQCLLILDTVHTRSDFLLFELSNPSTLLIGHDNKQHYLHIQKKTKKVFDYTERIDCISMIQKEQPGLVIVDDVAHYLFMGESIVSLMEWIYQLQIEIKKVFHGIT
jgi:hypothetical protein